MTSANLQLDPAIRAPHSDEYSVGVDREIGRPLALSAAYVHKAGRDFIGWTDVGGQYRETTRRLADGSALPVFELVNPPAARLFQLTNPSGYALTYHGLVMTVEKRRSHGWQAFGSYTLSRASGLQASSGTTAVGRAGQHGRPTRRPPSTSGAIRTISPTQRAGCPTIGRTCSG